MPKIGKATVKSSQKSAKSKCSVRSAKEGTRKRNVVMESEDSESNEENGEGEEEEEQFEKEDEEHFMRKIIEEESNEIFL